MSISSGANFSVFSASFSAALPTESQSAVESEHSFKAVLDQVSGEFDSSNPFPKLGKFEMIEAAINQAMADRKISEDQHASFLEVVRNAKASFPPPPPQLRPPFPPMFAVDQMSPSPNTNQMASFDFAATEPTVSSDHSEQKGQAVDLQMMLAATIGGRDVGDEMTDLQLAPLKLLDETDPYALFSNSQFVDEEVTHVSVVQIHIQGVLEGEDVSETTQSRLQMVLENSKKYIDMLMELLTAINPQAAQLQRPANHAATTIMAPPIPIVQAKVPKDAEVTDESDSTIVEAI